MVQYRVNRLQWYIRVLKEVTIKAIKLRTLGAMKLIIKGVKAKLKILTKEDI